MRILPVANIGRFYGGDDGGNGGAGGNGGGSDKPGGGEQPAGLTEDKVNELINKAMGARFRAFEEKTAKATEASNAKLLETFSATLTEQLSALKTEEGDKGKGKPATTDLTQTPEFRALKKQNEEIVKQLETERQEKQVAKAKAREQELHTRVQAELTRLGIVDPKAVRQILQSDGLIGYEDDDSDSVVFKDESGALPVGKGLESWVKTSPLAKRFMPASGLNGSGDRQQQGGTKPGSQSNGQGQPPSKAELGAALLRLSTGG